MRNCFNLCEGHCAKDYVSELGNGCAVCNEWKRVLCVKSDECVCVFIFIVYYKYCVYVLSSSGMRDYLSVIVIRFYW